MKAKKIGCVAAGAAMVGIVIAIVSCVIAVSALVLWNSNVETGTGVIEKKWATVFTSEECDIEDLSDCTTTTSTSHYIQLEDGRIYTLVGKDDYEALNVGDEIEFKAKGVIKGLIPTIVEFKILNR